MITYKEFVKRSYRLFKDRDNRKEIKELFLKSFKNDKPEDFSKYILHFYTILFNPEEIFFDGVISHRNEKLEKEIQREFIKFFLNENIDLFISLYPKLKRENQGILDTYLPILIRFLPEAKPSPRYFIALYLIMADILAILENIEDNILKTRLEKLSTKGFARYRVVAEIFEGVIDRKYLDKINQFLKTEDYYQSFIFFYIEILEDFQQTLKIGKFNNEQALFLTFSTFIYEKKDYKNLLKTIKENLDFSLLNNLKSQLDLDINTEKIENNIRNLLNF